MARLQKVWDFLGQDINDISFDVEEASGTGQDIYDAFSGLVEFSQGDNGDILPAFVNCPLGLITTALDSPLGELLGVAFPFVGLAGKLLNFVVTKTKKEPTLVQSIVVITQVAYLKSVKNELEKLKKKAQAFPEPKRSKNLQFFEQLENKRASRELKSKIKDLCNVELEENAAFEMLISFSQSKMAETFGNLFKAKFVDAGLKETTANQLVNRINAGINQVLPKVMAETKDKTQNLFNWYQSGGRENFEKYLSINTYVDEQVRSKPFEKVF